MIKPSSESYYMLFESPHRPTIQVKNLARASLLSNCSKIICSIGLPSTRRVEFEGTIFRRIAEVQAMVLFVGLKQSTLCCIL